MQIHFKNIDLKNSNIENKINNKYKKFREKKYIYIFSPDGIIRFDGTKLEKYYEKASQNKIDNNYKDILIYDNTIFFKQIYQIPLEHIFVDKTFIEYHLCYNTKIVIEKENDIIENLYLDTQNNIDIIENEISSFLTLFT